MHTKLHVRIHTEDHAVPNSTPDNSSEDDTETTRDEEQIEESSSSNETEENTAMESNDESDTMSIATTERLSDTTAHPNQQPPCAPHDYPSDANKAPPVPSPFSRLPWECKDTPASVTPAPIGK